MHIRLLLLLAVSLSLLACTIAHAQTPPKAKPRAAVSSWEPRTITVSNKDNNRNITLHPGDRLRVHLDTLKSSKAHWVGSADIGPFLRYDNSRFTNNFTEPVRLKDLEEVKGFEIIANDCGPAPKTTLLDFSYALREDSHVEVYKTWQIHVTIAPRPVKGK